jgi:hypothetical protein
MKHTQKIAGTKQMNIRFSKSLRCARQRKQSNRRRIPGDAKAQKRLHTFENFFPEIQIFAFFFHSRF